MKKVISFATMLVLVISLFVPAYAFDAGPVLSSTVCPKCNVQMARYASEPDSYEYRFQMRNIDCPNSDVETGSHLHVYFYNQNYYICSYCGYYGVILTYSKERCDLSGIYGHKLRPGVPAILYNFSQFKNNGH